MRHLTVKCQPFTRDKKRRQHVPAFQKHENVTAEIRRLLPLLLPDRHFRPPEPDLNPVRVRLHHDQQAQ